MPILTHRYTWHQLARANISLVPASFLVNRPFKFAGVSLAIGAAVPATVKIGKLRHLYESRHIEVKA